MRFTLQHLIIAILITAAAISAAGQNSPERDEGLQGQVPMASPISLTSAAGPNTENSAVAPAVQQLLDFKDSDVKFELRHLMNILRDPRHEGWILAAYPDPKTGRPLIGAGFSLDLPSREHPQRDPLNPHPFIEPSSAQLWQAAGLDSEQLHRIIDRYNDNLAAWTTSGFRRRIKTLEPQITQEEATLLLRISAIHAIYNAKAYCRNFDSLTASQQMALSQLVYQMGVNLEEFREFLNLMNSDFANRPQVRSPAYVDAEYWKSVQHSLIQSQWARLYCVRAISVIAMLDPQYPDHPAVAERRVGATLHPAVLRQRRGRSAGSLRLASYSRHRGSSFHKHGSRARSR
jgi:hypothetical protein